MTFEQQWIEYDYNPFIIFNSSGKVLSLNSEAQFLLGVTTASELFTLAQTYANINFGFKTSFLDFEYGRYKFFGLTVGYENEDEIGIKLYQMPSMKLNAKKPEGELCNIFTIVDLCIATNSIGSNVEFIKSYDPTIPDVITNSNTLIKILNKIYHSFRDNASIETKIFYRVGEHVKFEGKKYSIFSISVSAKSIDTIKSSEVKNFAQNSGFYVEIVDQSITLNIPMITA